MSPDAGPTFRFRRARRQARPDESLLAALARDGWPRLTRSIRYHRPRGPFCGTGDCAGCLVRVNGRPNVRSCQAPPTDGARVTTENAFPSPRLDLLGAFDLLLPHGLDTLRGFRRPSWAVPAYQRVVRRLAGYGRPPDRMSSPTVPPAEVVRVETVIVGAGPSGRAVATRLVGLGVRPLLIERTARAVPVPGADLLEGTVATFLPPPSATGGAFSLLAFDRNGRGYAVHARQVVVATGAYDGALLFEGADRPGVVTGDLVVRVPSLPFERAVIVGGGARAQELLEQLGRRVVAVVAPTDIQPEVVARANEWGIPLYPRSRVVRARGRSHVRSLELVARGDRGRSVVGCDAVVLAHRRLPNAQLCFQAGADRRWRNDPGAYFPTVAEDGRTSVPGLFAVGSVSAPRGAPRPEPSAVADALLGRPAPPPAVGEPALEVGFSSYYRELLAEPRHGKWVVCACEDVLLEELEEAVRRGFRGMEVVKRYTGVGTGLCQGRYCVPEALLVLAALEARAPTEVGTITQRPPVVPTPLASLASLADEFSQEEVA
jgi:sarcosine oxidase subunit alpha